MPSVCFELRALTCHVNVNVFTSRRLSICTISSCQQLQLIFTLWSGFGLGYGITDKYRIYHLEILRREMIQRKGSETMERWTGWVLEEDSTRQADTETVCRGLCTQPYWWWSLRPTNRADGYFGVFISSISNSMTDCFFFTASYLLFPWGQTLQ